MNIQYAVLNKDKANELVHADIRGTDLSKVIVAFDDKNNGHLVTNKQLAEKRISDDELFEIADKMTNSEKFSCRTLASFFAMELSEFTGDPSISAEVDKYHDASGDIWVLTNEKGFLGASVLTRTDVLCELYNKVGDYYILPSSIHEILAVPVNACEDGMTDALEDMVRSVNQTQVAQKDQLSDNVYFFDGKKISMAREHSKNIEVIKNSKIEARLMS